MKCESYICEYAREDGEGVEGAMANRLMTDDHSLLGGALALAARKAQTLESLAAELDVSAEDLTLYWFTVNNLRRLQGHALPVPFDTATPDDGTGAPHTSNNWYAPTWRLDKLLEEFQINEGLAVHYERILTDPEGGHFELNLAAGEVVRAVQLENAELDAPQLKRVCVQACEPVNGIELLVSNAGKILLTVEGYRDEPLSAAFIERLYADLVEGISIKEVREIEQYEANAVDELRAKTLESFCAHLWAPGNGALGACAADAVRGACGGCSNHTLVNALIALYFFKTFRLFPAGNNVLAYLLYFIMLHREGYHFSAHVPVVKLLYPRGDDAERRHCLPCAPEDLVVACDGYFDWTRFFEQAVKLVVDEQRWTMTKLDGMGRRRERFRAIIDADESMNFRQKEVLLEAVLHSNAEFTYGIHAHRYDVSYPCARSDFARLLDQGFLRQHDDGIRHFFVASDNFPDVFLAYLKEHCAEAFSRYYDEDGSLRDAFKSPDDIASEYNRDVGFYEKSLLDKTYIEHYDYRRTPIADWDGPQRRGSAEDE